MTRTFVVGEGSAPVATLRYRAHDKLMRALLYDDFSDGHIRSIPPAQSQRQTSLLDTNA